MEFNVKEKEILKLMGNYNYDLEAIDELFKRGADPNAYQTYDGDPDDKETLFGECVFAAPVRRGKTPDMFPLLKCFVENGLNVNEFADEIIGSFHFIYGNKNDLIEMTKYLLSLTTEKVNVEGAMETADLSDMDYNILQKDSENSNLHATILKVLEAYSNGLDHSRIFSCHKAEGQKIKNVYLKGNFEFADEDHAHWKCGENIKIVIECTDDILVTDGYEIYIDNNQDLSGIQIPFAYDRMYIRKIYVDHFEYVSGVRSVTNGKKIRIIYGHGKSEYIITSIPGLEYEALEFNWFNT